MRALAYANAFGVPMELLLVSFLRRGMSISWGGPFVDGLLRIVFRFVAAFAGGEEAVEVGVVPHNFSGVEGLVVIIEVEAGFVGVYADVVVPTDAVDDAFDGVVVDAVAAEFFAAVDDEGIDVRVGFMEGVEFSFTIGVIVVVAFLRNAYRGF